jgi:replicative DNA helicase
VTKNYVAPEGLMVAEAQILGGILRDPSILAELALETDDFAGPRHRLIFGEMRNLAAAGSLIDAVTITARLEQIGKLAAVGGHEGVVEISLSWPTASNVLEYAKYVRDEHVKRRVVDVAGTVEQTWRDGDTSGREMLDAALAALNALDRDEIVDDTRTIEELTREHVKWLEAEATRRMGGKISLTGFPTGVADLDVQIGGWQPGIVSVVCARPGHGKSTLFLATADTCSEAGHGVHVFSLEDPRKMYMNRAISRRSRVPIQRIATGELRRGDLPEFTKANYDLTRTKRPWKVDDRSGLSSEDIVRSVRRHRKSLDTKVVIVDYLQLLKRNARSLAKSRHEQISESLHELADAAKNDGMAYVVGSQLNRDLEKRDDKRPQESDLRESGTIEERAKCIVALYRGCRYYQTPRDGIDLDAEGKTQSLRDFTRTVQALILKNSQGAAPERIVAGWDGETARVW